MFFDTNIIINILSESPDKKYLEISNYYISSNNAYISEVVLMEILSWSSLSQDEVSKLLRNVLGTFKVKRHTRAISLKTSEIRRSYKNTKLPDAIIAATSICYNMPLITNNINDFKQIKELKLFDLVP